MAGIIEPDERSAERPRATGKPRLRMANREQVEFRACCWNELLAEDHQARIVWQYAIQLDVTPLLAAIKSVERVPGHPPIDPRIMLALWLYATLRGVGAAWDRRGSWGGGAKRTCRFSGFAAA